MARRTKAAALETKAMILDAAEKLFSHQGVAHTSLDAIAKVAGVTRGAIYGHFKNKVDLFTEMCNRVELPINALVDYLKENSADPPLEQIRKVLVEVLRSTVTSPQRRRVLTILYHKCEYIDSMGSLLLQQQQSYEHHLLRIQESLSDAVSQQQLPADLDVRYAALAFFNFFTGVLSTWLFAPHSFDLYEEAPRIVDGFLWDVQNNPMMRRVASVVSES